MEHAELETVLEARVLALLEEMGEETHIEAVAARLGIVRHTAAKYLQVLQAKGHITCRKVGNAKLWQPAMVGLTIRPLLAEDLSSVLKIQSPFPDEAARNAFIQMMEYQIECTDASLRLGAYLQDKLIGFVVGEIRLWEFGGSEHTGWIKALTVSLEFQKCGVGRKLGEALLKNFRERGVDRVRTLVDWHAGEMIAYFRSLGFQIMPILPLEKRLNDDQTISDHKTMVTIFKEN